MSWLQALAGEALEGRVVIDSFLDRYLVQMNAGTGVALSHDETLRLFVCVCVCLWRGAARVYVWP